MPPTRTEFEQYFAAFSKRLSEAIKGRESSPEGVKPTRKGGREAEKFWELMERQLKAFMLTKPNFYI